MSEQKDQKDNNKKEESQKDTTIERAIDNCKTGAAVGRAVAGAPGAILGCAAAIIFTSGEAR